MCFDGIRPINVSSKAFQFDEEATLLICHCQHWRRESETSLHSIAAVAVVGANIRARDDEQRDGVQRMRLSCRSRVQLPFIRTQSRSSLLFAQSYAPRTPFLAPLSWCVCVCVCCALVCVAILKRDDRLCVVVLHFTDLD